MALPHIQPQLTNQIDMLMNKNNPCTALMDTSSHYKSKNHLQYVDQSFQFLALRRRGKVGPKVADQTRYFDTVTGKGITHTDLEAKWSPTTVNFRVPHPLLDANHEDPWR